MICKLQYGIYLLIKYASKNTLLHTQAVPLVLIQVLTVLVLIGHQIKYLSPTSL